MQAAALPWRVKCTESMPIGYDAIYTKQFAAFPDAQVIRATEAEALQAFLKLLREEAPP